MESPVFGILVALLSFLTVVSAASYVLVLTAELEPCRHEPRRREPLEQPRRHSLRGHRAA